MHCRSLVTKTPRFGRLSPLMSMITQEQNSQSFEQILFEMESIARAERHEIELQRIFKEKCGDQGDMEIAVEMNSFDIVRVPADEILLERIRKDIRIILFQSSDESNRIEHNFNLEWSTERGNLGMRFRNWTLRVDLDGEEMVNLNDSNFDFFIEEYNTGSNQTKLHSLLSELESTNFKSPNCTPSWIVSFLLSNPSDDLFDIISEILCKKPGDFP